MTILHRTYLPLLLAIVVPAAACKKGGGSSSPPVDSRTTVALVYDDGTAYAAAGVRVFVDDAPVGTTDAEGRLTIVVPAGARTLRAIDSGLAGGGADLSLVTGGTLSVRMIGDLERPVALACAQVANGVLPAAPAAVELTVRSAANGGAVAIASFAVAIEDARADDAPVDVTPLFTLPDAAAGRLVADPGSTFATLAANYVNDVLVTVEGVDADGAEFTVETTFFVERHPLEVAVVAPPSTPGLDVTGRSVRARLIGTDVVYEGTSDAMGHVSFAAVPGGTFELTAQAEAGGNIFAANVAQFVGGSTSIGLVLLGLPDVLAGVPPTTVYQNAATTWPRTGPIPLPSFAAVDVVGGLVVTSATQDVVVTGQRTVTFAQGTARARLLYEVISVEYPQYVQAQSEFNDNWTLRVLAPNGAPLFERVRNVNSQLYIEPKWVPGTAPGTTGQLEVELDIAALTTSGPVDLVVAASATNIGDSILDTTVAANLLPELFRIQSIAASDVTPNWSCGKHGHAQKQQDQFSLPYAPAFHTAQRTLTAKLIGRPADAPVQSVRVELRALDGTVLATVLDEAPAANGRVRHVTGAGSAGQGVDEVQIDVTSTAAHPSPIAAATTPPADQFVFHVLVRAAPGGGATIEAERDSATYGALWRATLAARTGCRDAGGDEWASQATIGWLTTNLTKLGPVNDLSGEHDRNLGHATHDRGRSIDCRQFTTAKFAFDSGMRIFRELRYAAYLAINGDPDAAADVNAWFATNRASLEALIAQAVVSVVYVARAPAYAPDVGFGLPAGWFHTLLTTGTVTSGTETLTLAIGAWTAADIGKVRPAKGHLDHYHVGLTN